MAVPLSPFSELVAAVRAASVLDGCEVLEGNASRAQQGAVPIIRLIPRSGRYKEPRDNRALAGIVFTVEGRVWAATYDAVWDLVARLLQAVRDATLKTGYTWQFLTLDHDDGEPDTSKNGVFAVAMFATHIDISPAVGPVEVVINAVNNNITNT
jgi:hypothetical protein